MIKRFLKNIGVFLVTLTVCFGALLLVCQIPQSAIRAQSVTSLAYFENHGKYPMVVEGWEATRIDNYADCLLLNVIYNVEAEHPFYSAVVAPYYRVEGNKAAADYRSAIDGAEPNNEYSRYWHGSQVFIRPLLTVLSIRGLRVVMFGLFVILNVLLAVLLVRRKAIKPLLLYLASLLLAGGWMTAFSSEYVMTFLVMTAICLVVCHLMTAPTYAEQPEKRNQLLTYVFIVSGALTCFVDFLTTETLTFTIPFLLFLLLSVHQKKTHAASVPLSFREEIRRLFRWGVAWLASYAAMFAVKWILVYFVAGEAAFMNALQSAAFRVDGAAGSYSDGTAMTHGSTILVALVRNLSCLFALPQEWTIGAVFGLSLCVPMVCGALLYLFRGKQVDGTLIGLLLIIACVPYMRYAVLSNHACMHYFFTYRAQMTTIMALLSLLAYQLEPSYILSQGKKKAKASFSTPQRRRPKRRKAR